MEVLASTTGTAVANLPPPDVPPSGPANGFSSGSEIGGPPPLTAGIASVAARIQERAFQLSVQRSALADAEADLEEARLVLDEETQKSASMRRGMLSAVRNRHDLELEVIRWKKVAERALEDEEGLNEEARSVRERAAVATKKWNVMIKELIAEHKVRTESYRRKYEGRIWRRRERIRQRERILDKLALRAEIFREETAAMDREKERVMEESRQMDQMEEQEDEKIAAQAMQIRSTLNKRASLRAALEDAREFHRKAKEHVLRCE